MTRFLVLCCVMLFAFSGIAHAQAESAPSVAAPPPVSEADVVWQPTVEQLSEWVAGGMATAAADLDFFEMPAVGSMTWNSYEGVPLVGDRSLRFAAVITPELTSSVVGYGAAWEDETWAAIEADAVKVANDLASSLHASVAGGPMYFLVAVSGEAYPDMLATVSYQGQWRSLQVAPWGAAADYTPGNVGQAMTDPMWAARYLVTQEASGMGLEPADQVRIYLCTWARNAPVEANADFLSELPTPEWTDAKRARLAVGNVELLGWVDFDTIM